MAGASSATRKNGTLTLIANVSSKVSLLLTQIQRQTRPLEVALDAMLDHVASLTAPA
jgi:hypothetical protein